MGVTSGLRRGTWTEEEDILLRKCIQKYGEGKWHQVPVRAGLNRCRKSCRPRYLRPDIKRGDFCLDEGDLIIRLHKLLGNKWSLIAGRLPGRTANDVKNYWNSHLQKKIMAARREPVIKGKAANTNYSTKPTATIIVKPQPRTFTKNASWWSGKTTEIAEVANGTTSDENETPKNSSPASQQPVEKDNKMPQWWDNLFLDEEGGEGMAWSIDGGSAEDSITNFWSEQLSNLGIKEGDNCTHENQDGLGHDFSIDADLWDLLVSDNQAMQ